MERRALAGDDQKVVLMAIASDQVNPDLVQSLEMMLDLAKQGKIRMHSCQFLRTDNTTDHFYGRLPSYYTDYLFFEGFMARNIEEFRKYTDKNFKE